MKRTLAILLALCCLLALASCRTKASTLDTSAANKIVYGVRYIQTDDISKPTEEQNYYVIYKDHLEHHYYHYSTSSGKTTHYTVTYKYTVMDEGTLAYFFDSYVLHDNDNATGKILSNNSGLLLFSENVLSRPSGDLFVCEDYAKNQLPNFGK